MVYYKTMYMQFIKLLRTSFSGVRSFNFAFGSVELLKTLLFVLNQIITYLKNKCSIFFIQPVTKKPVIEAPKTLEQITHDFIQKIQILFLKTYGEAGEEYNTNIEPIFYSKKQFHEMLLDEDNQVENKWKTKLLFLSTPRGNVIMHYNVYKQGFSYYSDQTIPYNILNALAMKYVVFFRCRDFFMDEHIIPENTPSKLIKLNDLDEKKPTTTESTNKSTKPADDLPFAKFKTYNSVSNKVSKNTEKKKDLSMNRFICLGKITNFSFIQKPKVKHAGFTSDLLPVSIQPTKRLNYKDFKSMVKVEL